MSRNVSYDHSASMLDPKNSGIFLRVEDESGRFIQNVCNILIMLLKGAFNF